MLLRPLLTNSIFWGVSVKTLLIYYSEDDSVSALCRKSASKSISVCELRELSGLSYIKRLFNSLKGLPAPVSSCTYDLNDFESVILASDGRFGGLSPEMKSFIKNVKLQNKKVYCVIFGDGKKAKRAEDDFRTCVSLSGATVQKAVTVSSRAFKRDEEDVLYYMRHKIKIC